MAISITEDIRSITELKKNTNKILQHIHHTGRPLVLTVNGKAKAVLIDAKKYEKTSNALNMLKLLIQAEEDVKAGHLKEAKDFFKEFRLAKKI